MLTFVVVLGGILWALGYAVACYRFPFTGCRWCRESPGRKLSPSGRTWRLCRRCKGSGSRVRAGRRFWTWMSVMKKNAVG